jgi:predicted lipid-binding transport protein (Tim44 family)
MVAIVLLALVAVFVALRLYAILGQRTGHEQQPVTRPDALPAAEPAAAAPETAAERPETAGFAFEEAAAPGIRAIVNADPSFDVARFLDGAQAAYRMILEAYWKGEVDSVAALVDDKVRESLAEGVAERDAAGHRLDNRLIAIERAMIVRATLQNRAATICVRIDADIAAVTRDPAGEVVAGSLTDAVQSHDVWTFRRTLGMQDPNWILVETDEAD